MPLEKLVFYNLLNGQYFCWQNLDSKLPQNLKEVRPPTGPPSYGVYEPHQQPAWHDNSKGAVKAHAHWLY